MIQFSFNITIWYLLFLELTEINTFILKQVNWFTGKSHNWPVQPQSMYIEIHVTCIKVLGTSKQFPTSMSTVEKWGQKPNFSDAPSTSNQSTYIYRNVNASLEKDYTTQEQPWMWSEDLDIFHIQKESGWLAISTDIKQLKPLVPFTLLLL